MTRRILTGLALLAGGVVPAPAQAATVTIDLYNHYFQPTAIVAGAGDTVVLFNHGTRKVVQSYTDNSLSPTTVDTNQSVSFTFAGGTVGLRGDDLDPQTPALSTVNGGTCTGMCGRVTSTPPSSPPQTPTITAPAADATLTSNVVTFQGTAASANRVRLVIASTIRTVVVDGNGNWVQQLQLINGSYTATATSIHPDGFESGTASVSFRVSGVDTVPPQVLAGNPASVAGQPSTLRIGTTYVGHGAIRVNGVVVDDVQARKVTATIRDNLVPMTEMQVVLRCKDGANVVPCESATNPARVQYDANFLPPRPGHYVLTVRGEDGVGNRASAVQDIIILSPI